MEEDQEREIASKVKTVQRQVVMSDSERKLLELDIDLDIYRRSPALSSKSNN